jgi:hypothetical protein
MNWVVQFDKEFIQKLGRKEMRRYGVVVKYSGTVYVEVDVPNGEDPEEYALPEAEGYFTKICDWESEVVDVSEVDPND